MRTQCRYGKKVTEHIFVIIAPLTQAVQGLSEGEAAAKKQSCNTVESTYVKKQTDEGTKKTMRQVRRNDTVELCQL